MYLCLCAVWFHYLGLHNLLILLLGIIESSAVRTMWETRYGVQFNCVPGEYPNCLYIGSIPKDFLFHSFHLDPFLKYSMECVSSFYIFVGYLFFSFSFGLHLLFIRTPILLHLIIELNFLTILLVSFELL